MPLSCYITTHNKTVLITINSGTSRFEFFLKAILEATNEAANSTAPAIIPTNTMEAIRFLHTANIIDITREMVIIMSDTTIYLINKYVITLTGNV